MLKIAFILCTFLIVSSAFFYHKPRPRCGRRPYHPEFQQCCSGQVKSKYGNVLVCCGKDVIHRIANICCNGVPSQRKGLKPACCGRKTYDAASYKCLGGRVVTM